MGRKEDIRIKKTKDKLKQGVLDLMKNKDVKDISVTELCSYSGVNRNTFYSHYKEPSDILAEIETELITSIYETLVNANLHNMSMYSFVNSLFTLIYEQKELCSIIFSEHGNKSFIRSVIEMVRTPVTSDWINRGVTEVEADILFSYCVSGAMGVLENWVATDYRLSVDKLSEILTAIIIAGQTHCIKNPSSLS